MAQPAIGLPRRLYVDKWGTYLYRARRRGTMIFRPLSMDHCLRR